LETAPGLAGFLSRRLVVILVVKRHDVDAKLIVRLQKPLQLRVAYPSLEGLVFFQSLGEIMRFLHQGRQLVHVKSFGMADRSPKARVKSAIGHSCALGRSAAADGLERERALHRIDVSR
jgi:hypothetical protein